MTVSAESAIDLSALTAHSAPPVTWPKPLSDKAFDGLAGDIVHAIEPHTEADPVALLGNLLTDFGVAVGTGPHFMVGATTHTSRLFTVLVGKTSNARKGSSHHPIRNLILGADPTMGARMVEGLVSGEGLIHAVRDAVEGLETIKDKSGKVIGREMVVTDPGESDKRLLVVESEFARVLKTMERQGNNLSPVLRRAWDDGDLQVLAKTVPTRATGAHIGLVAHITEEELRRSLTDTEAANGFANRFLWLSVRRSKQLPDPQPFEGRDVDELSTRLNLVLKKSGQLGRMRRDSDAADIWNTIYADLSRERDGLVGAMVARAEAITLRLSMTYALLDASDVIKAPHLLAALALWDYSERSVTHIFGNSTGDPLADTILKAVQTRAMLTRTQIRDLFGRHESAARIDIALQLLMTKDLARMESRQTDGRPVEVWVLVG
jgi:hypothetical protein